MTAAVITLSTTSVVLLCLLCMALKDLFAAQDKIKRLEKELLALKNVKKKAHRLQQKIDSIANTLRK